MRIASKLDTPDANLFTFRNMQGDIDLIIIHGHDFRADMGEVVTLLAIVLLDTGHRIVEYIALERGALFQQHPFANFFFIPTALTFKRHVTHRRLLGHRNRDTHAIFLILGSHTNIIKGAKRVEALDVFSE